MRDDSADDMVMIIIKIHTYVFIFMCLRRMGNLENMFVLLFGDT